MLVKNFLALYECFCLPSLNDWLVLSILFPSSVKALCCLWPDNCPPLLHNFSLPPGMPFCRWSKETSPINFTFPYRKLSLREGKWSSSTPWGSIFASGANSTSQGKGSPIEQQGTTQSHPHLQLLLPPPDFPQGLHLDAVHWEGQPGMAAQLVQCLLVGQTCSVIRLSPTEAEEKKTWAWCKAIPSYINFWQGLGKPLAKIPQTQIPPGHASCPLSLIHQALKHICLQ